MRSENRSWNASPVRAAAALLAIGSTLAQARLPAPMNWTAAEHHQNMMEQLGIHLLRPGPSGNESAPNHANYDEATANPFPDLPDPLTLKDGRKLTNAAMWWNERRAEIIEDFERELYGRIPSRVPKITWKAASTAQGMSGSHPVVETQLTGHIDNSAYPLIGVEIQMTLALPAERTAEMTSGHR